MAKAIKKRGRPEVEDDLKKDHLISIRLNSVQLEHLEEVREFLEQKKHLSFKPIKRKKNLRDAINYLLSQSVTYNKQDRERKSDFADGDDGGGWEEFAFDDSEIVEKSLNNVASKDYLELLNRINIKNGRSELEDLFGIKLEKSNNEADQINELRAKNQNFFKDVSELTLFLNEWSAKNNAKDTQAHLLTLLTVNLEENEKHWLALEITRRNFLLKSISCGIELDLAYISHIHQWDLLVDDEIKNVIEAIDNKIFHFVRYHTSAVSSQLEKIQLKANYLGINDALIELKKTIMENDIQDAEYYLQMVNWLVLCDEITEAEVWIEYSKKLPVIPLNIHLEFMFFYVRFDHGYRQIAQYAARILPQLNKEDRRSLVPFLLKQIEVGYLDKTDLSTDVVAEIILYQNELN
jgi:hypothetical protein